MSKVNSIAIGAALVVFASVATELRFGSMPIGIGEVMVMLLFLWALRYRQAIRYLKHPVMLFWMGFIAIAAVAMLLGTVKGASSMHTAAAYLYSGCFSLMAIACLEQASKQQFEHFIKALVLVPGLMLLIPFLCFATDATELAGLLGINTDFPSRLSAWSTNPNQLGLLLLPIPFWLLAVYRDTKWQGKRWLRNFGLIWAFFVLGICVRSDALLLAWFIGLPLLTGVALVWAKPFNWRLFGTTLAAFVLAFASFKVMVDGPGREQLVKAETAVSGAVASIFGTAPAKGSSPAFAPGKSDSLIGVGFDQNKSGVRKTLWIHAYEAWLQAPFIGHGPGAFSYLEDPAKKEEAHNLGFDMLTQVGIIGVLLFAALYLWLLVKACQARDPYSLAVLVVLMIFSGAHFMLRQPVFSLYMIICALAVKHGIFTALREKPQPN
ncbi:O-antigen ligase family protein [Pseudomonas sp.]|uniref:O-antigen ligase family protein n=1 Tax=Pseudomonas sp. TaxID=306 RepID=UPI0031E0EA47